MQIITFPKQNLVAFINLIRQDLPARELCTVGFQETPAVPSFFLLAKRGLGDVESVWLSVSVNVPRI